jgi:hypothetical protein
MPLPLLLGIGAGILGGAEYLMAQQDQKRAQSLLAQTNSNIQNTPWGQSGAAAPYQAATSALVANAGMFDRPYEQVAQLAQYAPQANDIWLEHQRQQALAAEQQQYARGQDTQAQANWGQTFAANQEQNQIGNQMERERLNAMHGQNAAALAGAQATREGALLGAGVDIQQKLGDDYYKQIAPLAGQQDAFKMLEQALQPGASSADGLMASFKFFNMMEPNGMVRDDERQAFLSTGGSMSQVANLMNQMQGKGADQNTRDQIFEAARKMYEVQYKNAERTRQELLRQEGAYIRQGYPITTQTGRGSYDWSYRPGARKPPVPIEQRPIPEGYTDKPPGKR